MNPSDIEINGHYTNRDGDRLQIIAINPLNPTRRYVGIFLEDDLRGVLCSNAAADLTPVPKTRKVWLTLYNAPNKSDADVIGYFDESEAEAIRRRVTCWIFVSLQEIEIPL